MPNWCMNTLFVKGKTKDDVAAFVQPIIDNKIVEEGRDAPYHSMLETHVPLPNNKWDYDKAVATWGVKWPDRESPGRMHSNGDDTGWSYSFDSPWGPPVDGLLAISEQFPDLVFTISYYEPGMCFAGGVVIHNTEIMYEVDDEIPEFDYDADPDKANDDEMNWLSTLESKIDDLGAKAFDAVSKGDNG